MDGRGHPGDVFVEGLIRMRKREKEKRRTKTKVKVKKTKKKGKTKMGKTQVSTRRFVQPKRAWAAGKAIPQIQRINM